eukprot:TRINITY_DN780_c0_g1_i2.p1 TRINITY_DN780_c0_g1~~TRINITY_DN780_c0_g1_i2.p1  ORF type:complete len:383 (+),score=147.37 TRINITY_DN780_c0_g1_i2:69-1217(+)
MADAPPARIAVIGAAWWSQGWHIPQLTRNPDAKLVAIMQRSEQPTAAKYLDVQLESKTQLKARYGVPIYSSCEEMIADEAMMAEIDGVIICTAHSVHASMGKQFLNAGKHVMMEKPMTVCVREGRELHAAAAEASAKGLAFIVNNTANFREQCFKARECVAAGELGAVHHVLCVMYSPLIGLFDDPANDGWVRATGTMLQDDGSGNGFGWGQLSHAMAWVLYVTGLDVEEVTAITHRSAASGADLTDAVLVRCNDNASISVSAGTVWPGNEHGDDKTGKWFDIKVFGEKGVLSYCGDDKKPESGRLEVKKMDGSPAYMHEGGFLMENTEAEGHGPESLQTFITACRGLPYRNSADHNVGLQAVRFLEAMYRSAATKAAARAK